MPSDNQALLLQVSATVNKLEKQMAKAEGIVDKSSRNMERRAQSAATNLDRFFGKADPAKALDKIFDSTRFKVLDSGVARVGIFGSALEALGPAGLAAAAGIGAVAAAFAGAREAARFADDISDTAKRLHVTTDALQEYRYAIRAAGGEEAGADEALESFSTNLGKAQQGLVKGQRAFLALGFTKEQIKGFTDADTALKAVTERIQGLPSQQKDAIIAQLGLNGLKPLIEDGVTAMQRLRDEAHKVGIVMDADLVRRGGDLNDQFETVAKVIDVQLKSALVDLGPVLVGILQQMANLAKLAGDVSDAFRDIEHKRASSLANLRDDFIARSKTPATLLFGGPQKDLERAARAQAALDKSNAANAATPIKPTRQLIDTSKTPKGASGPRDDTQQRIEAINAALAGAARDLLQAQGGLTENIETRAEIERKIADEEAAQVVARLEKQKADLAADKGFTGDKAAQQARLDLAIAAEQSAAVAKQEAITRKAALAREDRQIEVYQATVEAQIAALEVEANIATTAAAREKIEKRILDLRQQLEKDLKETQIDRDLRSGAITPSQAVARKTALGIEQGAAQQQFAADHLTPMQEYIRSISDADTAMQNFAVHGVQQVTDALADAITGATSFKAAFSRVISSLLAEITRINLNGIVSGNAPNGGAFLSSIGSLFKGGSGSGLSSFLQGAAASNPFLFANGTDSAPGGMSIVGERGPELLNLPRGAQVIPNDILRGLSRGGNTTHSRSETMNIHVYPAPGMTMADARRTGNQIGAAASRRMAQSRKAGFS